jgi:glycosyltransferase involved in cell wall biosynthesis
MDAGLPVVTTRIRGMADHLREGVHALTIAPRDVAALVHALQRILTDAELRARMGRANREKVRDFAPEIVGREYLAVLREIAGGRPRAAG